jgi:DNA modification methylase
MKYFDHAGVELHWGDARDVLATLPDKSVHCAVTSPPYYGLRDYRTAKWDGGDPACDHKPDMTSRGGARPRGKLSSDTKHIDEATKASLHVDVCAKCGAVRVDKQIGLERTPEEYVATLVAILMDVHRVLRDDGTLWLNLGDSYAGSGESSAGGHGSNAAIGIGTQGSQRRNGAVANLASKNLLGVPWRVAFALQESGWILRSDIIWNKPNVIPESVTDRPTKSHEHLFLLAKRERYYYDHFAISEPAVGGSRKFGVGTKGGASFSNSPRMQEPGGMRNKRDVWTINTVPYHEAHYAVFPPALVEPCILAGTSAKGCCPQCGAPWRRLLEHAEGDNETKERPKRTAGMDSRTSTLSLSGNGWAERGGKTKSVGWEPTCTCGVEETVPCTVLDPFAGSGTTLMVAAKRRRRAVGIDLSAESCELATWRIMGKAKGDALVASARAEAV